MIKVEDLEKRYGPNRAVAGVSFEVAQGEIVGLLGHNGAGKTTIMKILTGFLEPTAGTVEIEDLDVTQDRIEVQKLIGYLPENAPLYPEMLVQEYLMTMAELRGIPEQERLQAVSDAVWATGLEERLVSPISTLSKGYKQRVGLAQAILHKPKLLILDEPTNGLDPVQIVEIRGLIHRLAKTSTIILSTHILPEIEAVCDRVVVLIDGHLAEDSPLEKLLESDGVYVVVDKKTKDVEKALKAIDGVKAVHEVAHEDDDIRYRLTVEAGKDPISDVVAKAHDAGWALREITPDRPSLEKVFRQLMEEHVESVRGKEAA